MNTKELSKFIKQNAISFGFDACGIAQSRTLHSEAKYLKNWLNAGYNSGMKYMENYFEQRINPQLLVDDAKSVIVVLKNYFSEITLTNSHSPQFSIYANGTDYHYVVKDALNKLLQSIVNVNIDVKARCFVDSAPVLEKKWAEISGLGWIGKNSCLITKSGSFFFIGVVICNLDLEYDTPSKNHCGNCNKCKLSCPTGAITSSGSIDANKCISYLTIENKNHILPEIYKVKFQNMVFGCDICQKACPYNKHSKQHNEPLFKPNPDIHKLTADDWLNLSHEKFKELFNNSPVKRAKYENLLRNIRFVLQ